MTVGGQVKLDLRTYQGVGQYNVNVIFSCNDKLDLPDYPVLSASSPNISVTITADDGNFITGSLSGTANDIFGQSQAVSGNFKVKKEL